MTAMTAMTTMLTGVVLPYVVVPDGLIVRQLPNPSPTPNQVPIEMLATGFLFAEQQMRRNRYPGPPKFQFVPGYDVVGLVTATVKGGGEALVGRRVAAVTKTRGWSIHALVDVRDSASSLRYQVQLREIGVEPIGYNDPNRGEHVRRFDPGCVLVAHDTAAQHDDIDNINLRFLASFFGHCCPTAAARCSSTFGRVRPHLPKYFEGTFPPCLSSVLGPLVDGKITTNVAARIPLREASRVMTLAQSKTLFGKVVLIP